MKVADVSMLREFVRAPMTTGAVAASGGPLARAAIAPVPAGADAVVVELGPGTGAMTGPITERLAGRGRQLAIEVNARLASRLATQHPAVEVVQADAADLRAVLTNRGIAHADVIVSGLPWAAFPAQQQERLLDAVVDSLSPEGAFTTFAYVHSRRTPAARRLRRHLEARFEEVLVGRTVWQNIPPALVYHARRPTTAALDLRGAVGGSNRSDPGLFYPDVDVRSYRPGQVTPNARRTPLDTTGSIAPVTGADRSTGRRSAGVQVPTAVPRGA